MVLRLGAKGAAPPGGGTSVKIVLPSVSRRVRGLKEVSGAMRGVKAPPSSHGARTQKPMVQVDHTVFWDWMLKWFPKDGSLLGFLNPAGREGGCACPVGGAVWGPPTRESPVNWKYRDSVPNPREMAAETPVIWPFGAFHFKPPNGSPFPISP